MAKITVDIGRDILEGDYFLVNQVLDFVVEVNIILCIMANAVKMKCTYLIESVEPRVSIHRLGPHWMDRTCRS